MNTVVVGIDHHSGQFHAARVDDESGRPETKALAVYGSPDQAAETLISGGRVVVSVPDTEVIFKQLHLVGGESMALKPRISFELAQSLLEGEENFTFDYHTTGIQDKYFGFVFRRSLLEQISEACGFSGVGQRGSPGFRMRAYALGKGYLTFCKKEEGELVCLADLTKDQVSICFVHRQHIVDLAFLSLDERDLTSIVEQEQLAIDLKTIVNFRQSALMNSSICLPLSALVLSGDRVDDDLRQVVQRHFPVGVSEPRFYDGFIGNAIKTESHPLERYLVALGLTAN